MNADHLMVFALETPCFACGAAAGERCRSEFWSDGYTQYPHFGRAGMPSSRGWALVALTTDEIGAVEKEPSP
jgi:hypothetical protein